MRTKRWVGAVAAGVLTATVLGSTATAPTAEAHSPRRENHAAAQAVAALTVDDAGRAAASLPSDFADVMGYRPAVLDGMVVNPSGGCSSPIPLPAEFDTACKAHDLGYDLLRYAHQYDTDLGAWARTDLDTQLDARMHAACDARARDRASCYALANTATTAVVMNSWRQGYGSPIDEPWIRYTLGAALAIAVLLLAASARSITTRLITTSRITTTTRGVAVRRPVRRGGYALTGAPA